MKFGSRLNSLGTMMLVFWCIPRLWAEGEASLIRDSGAPATIPILSGDSLITAHFPRHYEPHNTDPHNLLVSKIVAPGRNCTLDFKQIPLPDEIAPQELFKSTWESCEIQKSNGVLSQLEKCTISGMDLAFKITQSREDVEKSKNSQRYARLYAFRKGLHLVIEITCPSQQYDSLRNEVEEITRSIIVKNP